MDRWGNDTRTTYRLLTNKDDEKQPDDPDYYNPKAKDFFLDVWQFIADQCNAGANDISPNALKSGAAIKAGITIHPDYPTALRVSHNDHMHFQLGGAFEYSFINSLRRLTNMGFRKYRAQGSAYYPKRTKMEGGFTDRMGVKLNTLQDYFSNKADYVSVAMDKKLELRYGIVVKIPEIEDDYQQVIEFRVVDTGDAFTDKGYSRIDICVANKEEAKDETINGTLTLIFKD